jgi:hypothetical protein
MLLIYLFDHCALARIYEVGPVLAMNVPILAKCGSVPIDGLREFLYLNGFRQPLAATDNYICCTAGRLTFGSHLYVLAHGITVFVSERNFGARGSWVAAAEPPARGRTVTIWYVDGSTITISSRTTKKLHPRYCGTTSTTSAGKVWTRMSRGTAVPTESEKLTLLIGCTFSRVIDSVTRVRCWSLMLFEALTFADEDCAGFPGGFEG